jgi:hypothetical protein
MNASNNAASANTPVLTNGSGAAVIFSAGIGSFVLAVLAIAGDKSGTIKSSLIFYKPTGPLSGVTTTAILIWFFTWGLLEWRWRKKTVALRRIAAISLALLGLSLLLTFPPIGDLF